MIRQLPIVIVLAALGAALQAWGSEQEAIQPMRCRSWSRCPAFPGSPESAPSPGIAAQVDFESADWPELRIRPSEQPADWSGVRALAIPVDNPTAPPIV